MNYVNARINNICFGAKLDINLLKINNLILDYYNCNSCKSQCADNFKQLDCPIIEIEELPCDLVVEIKELPNTTIQVEEIGS